MKFLIEGNWQYAFLLLFFWHKVMILCYNNFNFRGSLTEHSHMLEWLNIKMIDTRILIMQVQSLHPPLQRSLMWWKLRQLLGSLKGATLMTLIIQLIRYIIMLFRPNCLHLWWKLYQPGCIWKDMETGCLYPNSLVITSSFIVPSV